MNQGPRHLFQGLPVNPAMEAPRPPGPWVSETRCLVCGARYEAHRGAYGFQEAAHRLRAAAKGAGDPRGGYRSRGAVLWWLRCLKLEDWYLEHYTCGSGWDFLAGRPLPGDPTMDRARLPDVVELIEEERPDLAYVRGHAFPEDHLDHDPEITAATLEAGRFYLLDWLDNAHMGDWTEEEDPTPTAPRVRLGRRLWARWGFPHEGNHGEHTRGLHLTTKAGRGAFPVTEVVDLDLEEARAAAKAARDAWAAKLVAWILEWFPEATDVEANGYPVGQGGVRWRLEGFHDRLSLSWHQTYARCRGEPRPSGDWTLWCSVRDKPAWDASDYADRLRPPVPVP